MPPNPAANTYPFVERVRYVIPLVYAAGLVLEGRAGIEADSRTEI